ncbi:outer membrane beta-barrel protein [Methylonatrum kenyense]|uniref:OmpW/AlkL family protein n=1 Tax=Methylonatrum kenyense TaxID=455253 RepID=UPI0020C00697|nr:OmpW family outer membrane protein [Methylonatrum kenyense]MCK8517219.1 outer membrane beta-barrel protein [Methylonatrum kenyense]
MTQRNTRRIASALVVCFAATGWSGSSFANNASLEAGDILVRGGFHHVEPRSSNGRILDGTVELDVGSNTRPSGTVTYMVTDSVGVELLVAVPFRHNIRAEGLGTVATTNHLPPTLSLQYHLNDLGDFRPYAGIGFNYTFVYNTRTRGALSDTSLSLKNSAGVAFQAGMDYHLTREWFVNAEVRYINIESRARLGGERVGNVKIDPVVAGLGVGYRF